VNASCMCSDWSLLFFPGEKLLRERRGCPISRSGAHQKWFLLFVFAFSDWDRYVFQVSWRCRQWGSSRHGCCACSLFAQVSWSGTICVICGEGNSVMHLSWDIRFTRIQRFFYKFSILFVWCVWIGIKSAWNSCLIWKRVFYCNCSTYCYHPSW